MLIGYFFLLIAQIAGAAKGYCGKKTSGYTSCIGDATLANIIRMLLCMAIGLVLILTTGDVAQLILNRSVFLISLLSGVSTAVFVMTWLIAVKKSAYMMLDVFRMMGVLIPLIASSLIFNENIKLLQWLGVAVLFAAVMIMYSYNNSINEKVTPSSLLLMIACGSANGIADFSQKLFTKCVPGGSAAVFNFYTYMFAALTLVILFAVTRKQGEAVDGKNMKKIFGYILIMAICLFANSYFKTLAAVYLSAVLLYPLNQGGSLILSAVMAAMLFKEKLTVKAIVGILVAFVGLLIINVL